LLALGLALDVPGFLSAGLPTPHAGAAIEQALGTDEWPALLQQVGAFALFITTLLGLTALVFARRRAGFFHTARGAIGVVGLLMAMLPIAAATHADAGWHGVQSLYD